MLFLGFCSVLCGLLSGVAGAAFGRLTLYFTEFRMSHSLLFFLLPIGGIIITLLYRHFKYDNDPGVNLVVNAINYGYHIPFKMFPLIFVSAAFSHLCGASVGRVSSTVQIGGALAEHIDKRFHLGEDVRKFLIMCSISAVFSGTFGVMLTAALFSIELASIKNIKFRYLPYTILSSFIAKTIALRMGASPIHFNVETFPALRNKTFLIACVIAITCGLISRLYCYTLHEIREIICKKIKHPYVRCFIFGTILFIAFYFGSDIGLADYAGIGKHVMDAAFIGKVIPYAFFLKFLFTGISILAGYKGGDVFPALFIGATLGSTISLFTSFPAGFGAALGLGAMFFGITNCKLASLLLFIEFFGAGESFTTIFFYIVTLVLVYFTSGHSTLYESQSFRKIIG